MPISRLHRVHLSAALVLLAVAALSLLKLAQQTTVSAAPSHTASCGLTVEIIAAPFAVVDSNAPGVQGPMIATMGARIVNSGGSTVTNVYAKIGDGVTPGAFSTVDGGSLSLHNGSAPTYFLGDLAPGAGVSAYWPVTYPATYDVSYPYTIWLVGDGGCGASDNSNLTTQSEISASANKLRPTGSTLLIYPERVAPGELINVQITGFELGTIGQGPQPLRPYDAWLQPVGNLDFDPACVRLVRSEIALHSVADTPFIDQLYFSGLTMYNADPADYVRYTFLALQNCVTTIQPYQEAASGTQEKYNNDYENSASRIVIASDLESTIDFTLASDKSAVGANEIFTIDAVFSVTGAPVGYPDAGSPAAATLSLPDGAAYVSGSAAGPDGAVVQFSTDGGTTWQDTQPAPAGITDVRWLLSEPVDGIEQSVSLQLITNPDYTGETLIVDGAVGILDSAPLATDGVAVNGNVPTPTPSPTPEPTPGPGVGSGEDGGLESEPLPGEPSAFLGDDEDATAKDDDRARQPFHKANVLRILNPSIALSDLMPAAGPIGTTPTDVIPVDVLATTSAPDAQAVDFVDDDGIVRAVALGVLTVEGPYEHDYGVCNRFKGYELDDIAPHAIAGLDPSDPAQTTYFWGATATQPNGATEEALIFHIFVDEASQRFIVDSRWIQDEYPDTFDFAFDYVFSMQVWSANLSDSSALLTGIVAQMRALDSGSWTIDWRNTSAPVAPTVLMRGVTYAADVIQVTIENRSDTFETITLTGTWRRYDDRDASLPFTHLLAVPPGRSTVSLSYPGLLDISLYLEHDGFTDKAYSGGGLWFTFNNGGELAPELTVGTCRPFDDLNLQDLLLAGCAALAPSVASQANVIGIGRTLNPNGRPVDVSPYTALRFWAKGDGTPIHVLLETSSVTDGDYHRLTVTPSANWQLFTLPLTQFTQQGFGDPVAFTGTDVISIIWLNAAPAAERLSLQLDFTSFTTAPLLIPVSLPADGNDTGERTVAVKLPGAVMETTATLYASIDDAATFTAYPMSRQGDQFTGIIPGRPLGSDVHYYIEAAAGEPLGRLPLDAPAATYRYRVDDRDTLLIDDFRAGNLRNRLDGDSGVFDAAGAGGELRVYRHAQRLTLAYDVMQSGQRAGYFTDLGSVDASTYTTLNLLVRGSEGNEPLLVSLRDQSGFEPRLAVGDILAGGLSSEWRWVQIPLAAFPGDLDLSQLVSLGLSFDNALGASAGSVAVGEIRLTALAAPVAVDTFDDADDRLNGRGLPYWTTAPGATLTTSYGAGSADGPDGFALGLNYDVQPNGYALWSTPLDGAAAAADGHVSLWLRADTLPLAPHLYLEDRTRRAMVDLSDYVAIGPEWSQAHIPLTAFTAQGIDPTRLESLQIVFEFGTGAGTLWLDRITIGQPGAPQAARHAVAFTNLQSQAIALHLPDGSGWSAAADAPWLGVTPAGYGSATLALRAQRFDLEPGAYSGQVTVTSAHGQDTIAVTLIVTETLQDKRVFLPLTIGR